MRTILIAGVLTLAATAAGASSESMWNLLDRTAHTECARQIKVLTPVARVARTTGRVTGIGGDGDLYYVLIFKGKERGADARWLCLYDKRAKKAQAREITD